MSFQWKLYHREYSKITKNCTNSIQNLKFYINQRIYKPIIFYINILYKPRINQKSYLKLTSTCDRRNYIEQKSWLRSPSSSLLYVIIDLVGFYNPAKSHSRLRSWIDWLFCPSTCKRQTSLLLSKYNNIPTFFSNLNNFSMFLLSYIGWDLLGREAYEACVCFVVTVTFFFFFFFISFNIGMRHLCIGNRLVHLYSKIEIFSSMMFLHCPLLYLDLSYTPPPPLLLLLCTITT